MKQQSDASSPNLKVLAWGTYDLSKPRVRILLQSLRDAGVELTECRADVWGNTDDKSQVKGFQQRFLFLMRWIFAYPKLIWKLLRTPKPDVIFIGYLGQVDVLILWPFARMRRIPVVWDAFISLYNTVVEDRRLVTRNHPIAWGLYALEWLATRAANRVILDTRAHADYFVDRFGIPHNRTGVVFVGAEAEIFSPRTVPKDPSQPFTVLFYGQFIPLHGIGTIIEAARLLENEPVRWVLIGKGQEQQRIAKMLEEHPLKQLEWIHWVPYAELAEWLSNADVCLGIFDDGAKAARVIPNKVFQIVSAGKPLITRDSPTIRELVSENDQSIWLVKARDAEELAKAVLESRKSNSPTADLHREIKNRFTSKAIGSALIEQLSLG